MKKIIVILITSLTLFNCKSTTKSSVDPIYGDFQKLSSSFFPDDINDGIKACIIIPNTGCTGCISSTETMLQSYVKSHQPVKFILTNILSYKTLKLKLGDSVVLNKNVYADLDNKTYTVLHSLTDVYPAIFYKNNQGEFYKYEYVQPDNPNALQHLQEELKK